MQANEDNTRGLDWVKPRNTLCLITTPTLINFVPPQKQTDYNFCYIHAILWLKFLLIIIT